MRTDVKIRRDEDGWSASLHAQHGEREHELVIGGHSTLDGLATAVEERLAEGARTSPLDLAPLRKEWTAMLTRARAQQGERTGQTELASAG